MVFIMPGSAIVTGGTRYVLVIPESPWAQALKANYFGGVSPAKGTVMEKAGKS